MHTLQQTSNIITPRRTPQRGSFSVKKARQRTTGAHFSAHTVTGLIFRRHMLTGIHCINYAIIRTEAGWNLHKSTSKIAPFAYTEVSFPLKHLWYPSLSPHGDTSLNWQHMLLLLLLFSSDCPPFLSPALLGSHLRGVYIPVKCTYTPLVFARTLWTLRHRRRTSAFFPLTAVNTSSGDPLQNKQHKHTEITSILRTTEDWKEQYMVFPWTVVDVINWFF